MRIIKSPQPDFSELRGFFQKYRRCRTVTVLPGSRDRSPCGVSGQRPDLVSGQSPDYIICRLWS